MHNLPERDFDAARPFSKLGTDVTEFKVAGGKAYLAPVYDMASKEIVAWDVSRHPDMDQQKRLLAMLAERLPAGAEPILHSDMGWQYQHRWWREELGRLGIRRSMSRRQRGDRAGVRPPEGRVLPRPRVRLVRAVQARAGRVHRALEHQTAPDTTRGTHPGGVPEHVPRGLGLYPN
ncbi:transposase [Bifidobacterium longum subsp. longum]|nr:transposase [Bifidobacterium longum subsp. longum]